MKKTFTKYAAGDEFLCDTNRLKILAFSNGYYMVRYKGAYPFVKSESEFAELLKLQNAVKNV